MKQTMTLILCAAALLQAQALTVTTPEAGTLAQQVGDEAKFSTTALTVVGDINAADLGFIREMAGGKVSGEYTEGTLAELDLSQARVVASDEYAQFSYTDAVSEGTTMGFRYYSHEDSLNEHVLADCPALRKVTLPTDLKFIDATAFYNNPGLLEVNITGNAKYQSVDGVLYDAGMTTLITYPAGRADEAYAIPATVTTLGKGAFCRANNLLEVEIPEQVTTLEGNTFEGCQGLTFVEVPSTVTTFGPFVFNGCSNLEFCTLPDHLTEIPEATFQACFKLQAFDIPASVTEVGPYAFSQCTSLAELVLPDGVNTIGSAAFQGCEALTAFVVPEGVTMLQTSTFQGDAALKSLTLPSTLTFLGGYALAGCKGLEEIHLRAVTPPTVTMGRRPALRDVDAANCALYVPAESLETYLEASPWNTFLVQAEPLTGIEAVSVATGRARVYSLDGVERGELAPGVNIVIDADGTARKVLK